MTDDLAIIRLPDPAIATGYRDALSQRAHFTVDDLGDGIAAIAPGAGAGSTEAHFQLHKLCDGASDLSAAATWKPLRDYPPAKELIRGASRVHEPDARVWRACPRCSWRNVEGELVAFNLAAMGAAQTDELPALLGRELPALFGQFPKGSLWLVSVSPVLQARLAVGRAQFAFELTPDIPLGTDMEELKALTGVGLGSGVDQMSAMRLPLPRAVACGPWSRVSSTPAGTSVPFRRRSWI